MNKDVLEHIEDTVRDIKPNTPSSLCLIEVCHSKASRYCLVSWLILLDKLDKTTQYDCVFFIHPNTNQGISDHMGTSSEGIM